ncbi:MAG: M1 family metallopeptidase [Bacteroidetes bacterium]|nr:M1 family metallopeptidase [Bacteroidota bacterium]
MFKKIAVLFMAAQLYSCSNAPKQDVSNSNLPKSEPIVAKLSEHDPHSFANSKECTVKHLDWEINIDFNAKILKGVAHWKIENKTGTNQLILDSRNLEIEKVTLNGEAETEFTLSAPHQVEVFGSALIINITPETQVVNIHYSTPKNAAALMWLEAEKTNGKRQPFLFTQSQAVLARTWIPCQDGPGVRFSYTADVTAPKDILVCMSAENPQKKSEDGKYHFEMHQPVPSYLMALVAGDLEFRSIGQRTGIYAEPEMADAVEYEFGLMQQMLEKAEALYGKYRWEQYDVVVLPPSFPFGGMENPRLTFATPTVVVGDRSLTSLIAHELAHSWSGNLVTNATWNDFWLNEGFTVYFEQRIMEEVYGRDYSEMLALNSYNGLLEEIAEFEQDGHSEATHLKLNLKEEDPDEGLTSIAYDKGYLFLRMLEETYGREPFDAFLKEYFNTHAFGVMTTEEFVEYLDKNLLSSNTELKEKCLINDWIYSPGLPANCPVIKSTKLDNVKKELGILTEVLKMNYPIITDTTGWSAHEYIYLTANLPKDISADQMAKIDAYFNFTNSSNSEILGQWFKHAARARYKDSYANMESFLVRVGRRKFLTPIYKALLNSPEGYLQAKEIYLKAKPNYHAVATETLDGLFEEYEKENKD